MQKRIVVAAVVALCAVAGPVVRGDLSLVELSGKPGLSTSATDAKISVAGSALRIVTGHANSWPGVTIKAPGGRWDLSAYEYVAAEVHNASDEPLSVSLRVDNPGANGTAKCNTGAVALAPGETTTLRVDLVRNDGHGEKLFGMRGGPFGKGRPIDPANVNQVLFFVTKPKGELTWEVANVRAGGQYRPVDSSFFPFIDTFGQYMHQDWPGKVHSLEELHQRRADEASDLERNPGAPDWDAYGGWKAGPTLKATGFFRVEKYQGKWWLVDPDGRLFFSQGIDGVGSIPTTPTDDRATWFADFPGQDKAFAPFVRSHHCLKGYYAGKVPQCFSFAGANLLRKYGENWRQEYAALVHRRLRSWGINTIANWSDQKIAQLRRTPYVATLQTSARAIEGSEGYWGKFPDPFDPAMATNLQKRMAQDGKQSAGDPWCLGYFVDNEMSWGNETSLGIGTLKSPADQPAKLALVSDLKARYSTVEKLNAAWGTKHASWEALLASRESPDAARAAEDLKAFYTRVAEQYFRTVRTALKQAAPNQLYLGCRFAWVNPLATAAAAKHCDVVSFNLYKRTVADFKIPSGEDVPLIIGEFHFGALDRGMFHQGLVPVADQGARAEAYKQYVRGAMKQGQFVGCHWFEYQDEPVIGRVWDDENYQIGFVDVCDTPYAETIAASREVAKRMYAERAGK